MDLPFRYKKVIAGLIITSFVLLTTGGQHRLYKYKVNDDLSIEISNRESYNLVTDFETWAETTERLNNELQDLENQSLALIAKILKDYPNHKKAVFTSTGKDSMVVLDLVQRLIPDVSVYFNNTTMDVADTYKIVKAHRDWITINPDIGFYKYIQDAKFVPTRFSRGCCTVFKEGKTIEYFKNEPQMLYFMGVRNEESAARADREDFCKNPKWGNRDWINCLPIRKWSELFVWLYIFKHNIEINSKYRKGYSRCGCAIACPYYTKYTWVLDKYWYRLMFDRWREILRKDFSQENRWTKLNCTADEYANYAWNGGLYRKEPTEAVIQEFMEHKGFADKYTAMQYFNKVCVVCGKNVRQNDVIAMNLKLHGRNTDLMYCKKHLKIMHNLSEEDWSNTIEDFKRQECVLF